MMVVQHNMMAMNGNRLLKINTGTISKNTEKLSSGYKINRAADDAAGLAISEKMRRQIRGLTRASENAQDGVSFCQIADGALNEIHDMLKRGKQIAIQASNATLSDTDRSYLQQEVAALNKEIDRVSTTTVFNEINIFKKGGTVYYTDDMIDRPNISANQESESNIYIEWSLVDVDGNKIGSVNGSNAVGSATSYAGSDIAQFIQKTASETVNKLASSYPTLFSKASTSGINIGLNLANIDGGGNVLASAGLSMSSSNSSTKMNYVLNVDTSDYPIDSFSSVSDDKKADLAATIAHEMTHLVMYDTVTSSMLDGRTTSFPDWFVEGMAQTSSGDNGWVSNRLNPSSSDAEVKNYMSKLYSMPYGAGYLGTMFLGAAASGVSDIKTATSADIKKGLDKILSEVATGKSFNQAIADNTKYANLSSFENAFREAEGDSLGFVKNLLTARGSSGAGSLLGSSLGAAEKDVFSANPSGVAGNYTIQTGNTQYENVVNTGIKLSPVGDNGSGEDGGEDDGDYGGMGNNPGGGGAGGAGGPSNPMLGIVYHGDFNLQVGSEMGNLLKVWQFDASASALFLRFDGTPGSVTCYSRKMNVSTIERAQMSLEDIDNADQRVSSIRSYYGATQNRLEHTIKNLDNVVENTTAAESAIRDTDMAKEMVAYSNNKILQQASMSILGQSNQSNQDILRLLG